METRENDSTIAPRRQDRPARILIVGGHAETRADLVARLQDRNHRCSHVNRLDEAQRAIAQRRPDLILLSPELPDGDGLDIARQLQRTPTPTRTIVFSESGSFQSAIPALRSGAVDFIRIPLDLDEFADRIEVALQRTPTEAEREKQITKLRKLCRELSSARDEISDQFDVLCYDMMSTYQDLTDQVDEASMASEFRTLLRQELDLEEALRTTLEYLLVKTGPTNAAVFLPDSDQIYSLGAYVNYDCPRESIDRLLDHLCCAICPQMSDETDFVKFDDAEEFATWLGMDDELFADSQVVAFSCQHEGECLAIVVLFRSTAQPFEPKIARTLDLLRTIFAEQLSQIIKVHHRTSPEWPKDQDADEYDDDFGLGFGGVAA